MLHLRCALTPARLAAAIAALAIASSAYQVLDTSRTPAMLAVVLLAAGFVFQT
jgi:hypothetical protein